jgi:GDPmannose 4,6-dehydratase
VKRSALITGITGQDGAYLAKLLLEHGYRVVGAHRHDREPDLWRLQELGLADRLELFPLNLADQHNTQQLISQLQPDEIYNLAAQSFVGLSFEQPLYTADIDALGVTRILESIRQHSPRSKFYQASSSEMFGKVQEIPQNEATPFYPRSPYGAAKVYAHWMTVNYREAHQLFTCSGILFNHESPFRPTTFVTRKITLGLARLSRQEGPPLQLGNLDAERDWGFAGDYVQGMWKMLQQDQPQDFVLATGIKHSVRQFVSTAAAALGIELVWQGSATDEVGVEKETGRILVEVVSQFFRPAEVDLVQGDSSKAKRILGWEPRLGFEPLVELMVQTDLQRLNQVG